MTETTNDEPRHPKLLDSDHIKGYFTMIAGVAVVVSIYYVLSGSVSFGGPPGRNFGGPAPGGGAFVRPGMGMFGFNLWPLWGSLVSPSLGEIAFADASLGGFGTFAYALRRNNSNIPRSALLVPLGIGLMVATNLIQGWSSIVSAIGGS